MSSGDDVGVRECNRKIRLLKDKYNEVTQKAGLDPHYDRMSVVKGSNNINTFYRNKNITHRKTAESGKKIIDKATYNKLTKKFVSRGGLIIRGEEAAKHLGKGHSASYLPSLNAAFIRDDATVSDVLEEMYHAEQDRNNMYGSVLDDETIIKREIDAQKYLISVAERYKIPLEETEETKRNLADYENQLKIFE
ncbi:MAG: hypothetical protein IJD78_05695 [Clostridia bacterium]|nr:hypothetical protein [Clostridia bacterium]